MAAWAVSTTPNRFTSNVDRHCCGVLVSTGAGSGKIPAFKTAISSGPSLLMRAKAAEIEALQVTSSSSATPRPPSPAISATAVSRSERDRAATYTTAPSAA